MAEIDIVPLVTESLGDSSYLLISNGQAAAIDPQRDIRRFLAVAEQANAPIERVFETHVHNDYISGGPALMDLGAKVTASARANLAFPHQALQDGDEVRVGAATVRAVATPGHTYEHMAYLVLDGAGKPMAAFSGGNLLVASAGRSDLLGPDHTEELARMQFESGRRLAGMLTTGSRILPTHGAGSFCSTSGGTTERMTTLAAEQRQNPALTSPSFEVFKRIHLGSVSPTPAYYQYMAPINRAGDRRSPAAPRPERMTPAKLASAAKRMPVLDLRARSEYVAAHVPGSIALEECPSLTGYVSWLYPFNAELALVTYDEHQAERVTTDLFRIGYERVAGYLPFHVWLEEGHEGEPFHAIELEEAADALRAGKGQFLDVRFEREQRDEPLAGARELPFDRIREWEDNVQGPLVLACASGQRATIAATYLASRGTEAVPLIRGGAAELRRALSGT